MPDISTELMGIKLSSPVIVGASSLSGKVDNFKKAQDAGAGAMVVYSLFQEQMELEHQEFDEALMVGADHFAESLTYFPQIEFRGSREHLMWIEKTRQAVTFPIIGSVNAISVGNWVGYAKDLENAGCNAIELNLYSVETDPRADALAIEERSLQVVASVKAAIGVPLAVKISPWYTSVASFVRRVVEAGADGVVLFNRFYQPSIDPTSEALTTSIDLSRPEDTRLPLRWIGLLSGRIHTDFVASTGVDSVKEVASHILAGAKAVQTVSSLYRNGIEHVVEMNKDLTEWMESKGYSTIEDFRGKVSSAAATDPYAFERAQYIKTLLGNKK